MESMEAASPHAHACALRMLHEHRGMPRVHACVQSMLHDHVGMARELCDAVCTLHAWRMAPGTPLVSPQVCFRPTVE